MTHTITGKLNRAANQHPGDKGTTFFVEIGEQHYNFKTKEKGWTNYSAAIFGNQSQFNYLSQVLVEGAIVSVTGTALIIDMPDNPEYKPRLQLQDAKLAYAHSGAPDNNQAQQQQAPQQQQRQQAPQQQQGMDDFDQDIPF